MHFQECFAWNHRHVNIYAILLSNILHQLYKGIIIKLVGWITKSIKKKPKPIQMAKKRGHTRELKLEQTSNLTQLDERFRKISLFTGLNKFKHYNKVVQWTSNEEKAMVKQLIAAATPLLMQDAPEAIYCARAILDFTILAQYPSHNDETLFYMEYALYGLNKTKIAFENHCPIDIKLFRPIFNYPKFHVMTHFVQCNWDYGSAINYDTAYNDVAHKYFLKTFYERTNKKKYESQILKHNIRYTKVIAMQDVILIAKIPVRSAKIKELVIDTSDAEIMRVCNATNVLLKYNWHLDLMHDEAVVDLGLQSIKKY